MAQDQVSHIRVYLLGGNTLGRGAAMVLKAADSGAMEAARKMADSGAMEAAMPVARAVADSGAMEAARKMADSGAMEAAMSMVDEAEAKQDSQTRGKEQGKQAKR